MPVNYNAEKRADATHKKCCYKESFFADTPLASSGFPFVRSVYYEYY